MIDLTLKTAALLEELGHTVEEVDAPVPPGFRDDFLLYWSVLAAYLVRTGRRHHGRTWDPSRHDNLTLGLARHATRNLHRLPGAIRRLRRTTALSAQFYASYDVTLTPDPRHGHATAGPPRPDAALRDRHRAAAWTGSRSRRWQNATGDPAISLPLATVGRRDARRDDVRRRGPATRPCSSSSPTSSRRPGPSRVRSDVRRHARRAGRAAGESAGRGGSQHRLETTARPRTTRRSRRARRGFVPHPRGLLDLPVARRDLPRRSGLDGDLDGLAGLDQREGVHHVVERARGR